MAPAWRVPRCIRTSSICCARSATGITFAEAWPERVRANFGAVAADVIGRNAFIKNKRATGRAKDLGDVEALGEQA